MRYFKYLNVVVERDHRICGNLLISPRRREGREKGREEGKEGRREKDRRREGRRERREEEMFYKRLRLILQ